jgi:hypothetical protein
MIRSRRMRGDGHVARLGEVIVAYSVLVWKPERKRTFASPRQRWEGNIKIDHQEMGWGDMNWIDLSQDKDRWRALVNVVMQLRVQKMWGLT